MTHGTKNKLPKYSLQLTSTQKNIIKEIAITMGNGTREELARWMEQKSSTRSAACPTDADFGMKVFAACDSLTEIVLHDSVCCSSRLVWKQHHTTQSTDPC